MNRTTLIGIFVACLVTGTASAQPSAPVVTRTDVIYGRVEGSALLANIAYPDGPGAEAGDHLGAWRAVARRQSHRRQQHQGGAVGGIRVLRDVDRLPTGGRLTGAGALSRPACAIRWLHAHADDYRIDPDRVYLIGQSAGGQMVSLMATLGEGGFPRVGGWEKARSDVRAVISVAATYELNTLSWGDLWTPVYGQS